MKPWEIIKHLETNNSRLFKEEVVSQNIDDKEFQTGVKLALNPYDTFGVKLIPISKKDGSGLEASEFMKLALSLSCRCLTGNAAKAEIEETMNKATMDQWNYWYRRILLKDLKCGVSEKTINKMGKKIGFEIPRFHCMLATNGENNKHMKGECLIEYKYDGVRAITIVNNEKATIYSRNGKVYSNFPHIEEALSKPEFEGMVFDGEIMSDNFTSLMKQVHRKEGAQTEDAYLALFDMITIEEFNAGVSTDGCYDRKIDMEESLHGLLPDCIRLVDYEIIDLEQEHDVFMQINKEAIENGYEGIMVKPVDGLYECKRSNAWFKIKPYIEVTLTVESIEEGQGKFEGTTGALVCAGHDEGKDIKVNVGGGLTDVIRDSIWKDQDAVLGQLIEIRADSISQNQDGTYSLRFPRFKTFRGFVPGEKL